LYNSRDPRRLSYLTQGRKDAKEESGVFNVNGANQDARSIDTLRTDRFAVKHLLLATAVVAIGIVVAKPMISITSDPEKFAASLSQQTAARMMLLGSFGIVGFPLLLGAIACWICRQGKSPVRMLIAIVLVGLAIGTVPMCIAIARACAFQVAG
jgi:hypothetical protein